MLTKDKDLFKAIPVKRLMELLAQFPDEYLISVSRVDDLLVLTSEEKWIGFIELTMEDYTKFEEEQKE